MSNSTIDPDKSQLFETIKNMKSVVNSISFENEELKNQLLRKLNHLNTGLKNAWMDNESVRNNLVENREVILKEIEKIKIDYTNMYFKILEASVVNQLLAEADPDKGSRSAQDGADTMIVNASNLLYQKMEDIIQAEHAFVNENYDQLAFPVYDDNKNLTLKEHETLLDNIIKSRKGNFGNKLIQDVIIQELILLEHTDQKEDIKKMLFDSAKRMYVKNRFREEVNQTFEKKYLNNKPKETMRNIWDELKADYQQIKNEFNEINGSDSRTVDDVKRMEEKYIDLTDKLRQMENTNKNMKTLYKNRKILKKSAGAIRKVIRKEKKESFRKFISNSNKFLSNARSVDLVQMFKDKEKIIFEIECKRLQSDVDHLQARIANYLASPYDKSGEKECNLYLTQLDEFKKLISLVEQRGVMDKELTYALGDFEKKFSPYAEELKKNNQISYDAIRKKDETIAQKLESISDTIYLNENPVFAKQNYLFSQSKRDLLKIYEKKIESLSGELAKEMSDLHDAIDANSANHRVIQNANMRIHNLDEEILYAEDNFNELTKIFPWVNHYIQNVPSPFVNDNQYKNLVNHLKMEEITNNFTSTHYAALIKTVLRGSIISHLEQMLQTKNENDISKYFPVIYDTKSNSIKQEFKDLFYDDKVLYPKFNQLVDSTLPLFNAAPVLPRGITTKEKYENMLADADVKMKKYDKAYNDAYKHLHPTMPETSDDVASNELRTKFRNEYDHHVEFITPIGREYKEAVEEYNVFKEKLSKKVKVFKTTNVDQDLVQFNAISEKINKLNQDLNTATAEQEKSITNLNPIYNDARKARDAINRVLNTPLKGVVELAIIKSEDRNLANIPDLVIPKLERHNDNVIQSLEKNASAVSELIVYLENIKNYSRANPILDDLKVLKFFHDLPSMENHEIDEFIYRNLKSDPKYKSIYEPISYFNVGELSENISDGLLGKGLLEIMERINHEKLALQADIEKLESKFNNDAVKFYEQAQKVKEQVMPAYDYFSNEKKIADHLFSPNISEKYFSENLQKKRQEFNLDNLLNQAQELEKNNPFKPKRVVIVNPNKSQEVNKAEFKTELEQKIQNRINKKINIEAEQVVSVIDDKNNPAKNVSKEEVVQSDKLNARPMIQSPPHENEINSESVIFKSIGMQHAPKQTDAPIIINDKTKNELTLKDVWDLIIRGYAAKVHHQAHTQSDADIIGGYFDKHPDQLREFGSDGNTALHLLTIYAQDPKTYHAGECYSEYSNLIHDLILNHGANPTTLSERQTTTPVSLALNNKKIFVLDSMADAIRSRQDNYIKKSSDTDRQHKTELVDWADAVLKAKMESERRGQSDKSDEKKPSGHYKL